MIELPRYKAPRVGDHKTWEGWLAQDNVEHIAAVLRDLLVGKRFAFAEFNTGFSHMPLRINPQARLLPDQRNTPDDGVAIMESEVGQAHIVLCHDTGVLGLSSQLETQPPFGDRSEEIERRVGWAPRIHIGRVGIWGGGGWGVQIQQKVPAGHLTNWTFAPHQETDKVIGLWKEDLTEDQFAAITTLSLAPRPAPATPSDLIWDRVEMRFTDAD